MATYSRVLLSGTTDGQPLVIVTGTTIHTAIAGSVAFDEVYIWASNIGTTTATLSIDWGGTTNACTTVSIPANSPPIPIMTGQVLNNSKVIKGTAVTASQIVVTGYVNRIV